MELECAGSYLPVADPAATRKTCPMCGTMVQVLESSKGQVVIDGHEGEPW